MPDVPGVQNSAVVLFNRPTGVIILTIGRMSINFDNNEDDHDALIERWN